MFGNLFGAKRPTEVELVRIQKKLKRDPTSKFLREEEAPYGEKAETNDILRVLDAWSIKNGEPILSCRVENDRTGAVSSVFWESVDRYGLRVAGETDTQVFNRICDESRSFNKNR